MKRIFISIYVLLILVLFIILFGVGTIMEQVFKEDSIIADIELSKGTFYLISDRLTPLDESQWPAEMATIKSRFGYPVRLDQVQNLNVAGNDRQALMAGKIVLGNADQLIQKLPDSDIAVIMEGPFPGEEYDILILGLFLGVGFTLLVLPALAWAYLLNRDIKKIKMASNQFAAGRHSARALVGKLSQLAPIASAFNSMAEKTQVLLSSQKEFANSLSHEIRTPLARIKFSLAMLLDAISENPQAEQYHNNIKSDAREIESLVDDMLAFARFERENQTAEDLSQHELVSWIKQIIQIEKNTLIQTPILFDNQIPESSFFVPFEPKYLGWALKNLIRNAGRYARRTIIVTLDKTDHACLIHVEDDGPGIPEKDHAQIFKPFFRVDKSRSKQSGGYGLGLSIAKGIMNWHKGDIQVATSTLSGARFTLSLPL